MADIIEEKDKILSFTLFKVEKGAYPRCPKCREVIDPMEITELVNKAFCKEDLENE